MSNEKTVSVGYSELAESVLAHYAQNFKPVISSKHYSEILKNNINAVIGRDDSDVKIDGTDVGFFGLWGGATEITRHRLPEFVLNINDLVAALKRCESESWYSMPEDSNNHRDAFNAAARNLGFTTTAFGYKVSFPTSLSQYELDVLVSEHPTEWLLGKKILKANVFVDVDTSLPQVHEPLMYGPKLGPNAILEGLGTYLVNPNGKCLKVPE